MPRQRRRSARTAAKEIAALTRHDTNIVQVRRCRGCILWRNFDRQSGVQSFGGNGILVISDQRMLAYLGTVRLFHAKWETIAVQNPADLSSRIEYSKDDDDTLLLCLTIQASLFPGIQHNGDLEYRFETDRASLLKRRIQYLLHWYVSLECPPGTPRRYASEICC